MLLQRAHAHSLCLKFGACARHALVKPLCGGIPSVCILARVKGFGKNQDDFINRYSPFVRRRQRGFSFYSITFTSFASAEHKNSPPWYLYGGVVSVFSINKEETADCEQSSLFV